MPVHPLFSPSVVLRWSWATLGIHGVVDVEAQAWLTQRRVIPPISLTNGQICFPGLCITLDVAVVQHTWPQASCSWLGGDLQRAGNLHASARFRRPALLSFTRGELASPNGSPVITGFSPTPRRIELPPRLQIDIEATATASSVQSCTLAFTLVSSIASGDAEAYAAFEARLDHGNFAEQRIGASSFTAIANQQMCTNAIFGCSQQCASNHDTRLRFYVTGSVYGEYKLYMTSFFGFGGQVGSDQIQRMNNGQALFSHTLDIYSRLYLFPPSSTSNCCSSVTIEGNANAQVQSSRLVTYYLIHGFGSNAGGYQAQGGDYLFYRSGDWIVGADYTVSNGWIAATSSTSCLRLRRPAGEQRMANERRHHCRLLRSLSATIAATATTATPPPGRRSDCARQQMPRLRCGKQ